jgi:hypothetical protein
MADDVTPLPPLPRPPEVEHLTPDDLAQFTRELAEALGPLHGDAEALRAEMHAYRTAFERADKRTTRAIVVGTFVGLVLAIGVMVACIQAYSNVQITGAIRDCTEPGGHCYEENQVRSNQRTAPIVGLICEAIPSERLRPPCPPR